MITNTTRITQRNRIQTRWTQWLAGLIDGDGYFGISKDGYAFLEITMGLEDESLLAQIKQKLGGSLKLRSNAQAVRYRLKAQEPMTQLALLVNGEIRNLVRVEQFKRVCKLLGIEYLPASTLTAHNGYTAGLFDADGTITITVSKTPTHLSILTGVEGKIQRLCMARGFHQLTLNISSKYQSNVSILGAALGIGSVICDNSRKTGPIYFWVFRTRTDVYKFVEYTRKYPLRSAKRKRLFLIASYFQLIEQKAHLAAQDSMLAKAWKRFCRKWF
jgi:ubiquinol-cytochrome c reductase cytochrome b subunit